MSPDWTRADAWHRRDVAIGSWLTVSRTRRGDWTWRLSRSNVASPVATSLVFASAGEEMADADATVRFMRPRAVRAA